MRKYFLLLTCFLIFQHINAQSIGKLTVEKIMKDPEWIGTSPSGIQWNEDGKTLYFQWNPEGNPSDSLYFISISDHQPKKLPATERAEILFAGNGKYNDAGTHFVYSRQGDIFLKEVKSGSITQITNTARFESNPTFAFNDKKIIYTSDQDIYAWDIQNGSVTQISRFVKNQPARERQPVLSDQQQWLKNDQLAIFDVLAEKKQKREAAEAYRNSLENEDKIPSIIIGDNQMRSAQLSENGRYIAFLLFKPNTE